MGLRGFFISALEDSGKADGSQGGFIQISLAQTGENPYNYNLRIRIEPVSKKRVEGMRVRQGLRSAERYEVGKQNQ